MVYEKHILQILSDAGEQGVGVRHLAKHVYNLNCTLFSQPDLQEIYSYVQNYLRRHSGSSQSLIERTERWGHYRLNTNNNATARQLMLEFHEEQTDRQTEVETDKPEIDLSLSLFD